MLEDALDRFFYWINERHRIFLKKAAGEPPPWTEDPILGTYKFTNAFRELDRTTVWMRENWTNPNILAPLDIQFFNVCFFRMFGTMEFADAHGYVTEFYPEYTKDLARQRLENKQKVFTGAYIITNQGLKLPKEEVVVDLFLKPIWDNRQHLLNIAQATQSLKAVHEALGRYRGWGGGGFMAYEAVTDMNYTPVMPTPLDKYVWANAGPGAYRGLNRLHGRPLTQKGKIDEQQEMRLLLALCGERLEPHVKDMGAQIDMRMIEHSLCEFDKYERVRLGEGKPRSLYKPKQ